MKRRNKNREQAINAITIALCLLILTLFLSCVKASQDNLTNSSRSMNGAEYKVMNSTKMAYFGISMN